MARYTATEAMVSMEATKTFPASTWRGEPLRKDIAAVPDSNPKLPAQICRINTGENRILPSFSQTCVLAWHTTIAITPRRWLAPSFVGHSRPSQEAKGKARPPQQKREEEWRGTTDWRGRETKQERSYPSKSTNRRPASKHRELLEESPT